MPQTNGRILVIDDEPDVVSYLETLLRDNGYEVRGTTESSEAMELARQFRPDLICLDISMPEPTGVRLYRDLRQDAQLGGVPVLMITGVIQQFKDFIHHRKHVPPPDGYIAKPFEPAELLATVTKLVKPQA